MKQSQFKKELPKWKIQQEFIAKISLECNRRCLDHRVKDESLASETPFDPSRYKISHGEQLCLNRCFSKIMNVKEIVDRKLENQVEPPLLFNQNLP